MQSTQTMQSKQTMQPTQTTRFVSVQTRLNSLFSLLFLAGAIVLVIFLQRSAAAISYNSAAHTTYAQVQQWYRTKMYLQQFERALNQFELTSDYDWLDEYNSSYARLVQSLEGALAGAEPAEQARLQALIGDLETLRGKFDQVVTAVDEEDWEGAAQLHEEAYASAGSIFEQIDGLIQSRTQALTDLRGEVDRFARLGRMAIWLSGPVFLAILALVILTIARQINAPLIRLTNELKPILAGQFNPSALGKLPERRDEIGYLGREYVQMAAAVQSEQVLRQQEIEEIRAKIR